MSEFESVSVCDITLVFIVFYITFFIPLDSRVVSFIVISLTNTLASFPFMSS